jgi:erythromycin esterase-like protein
MRRDHLMRSIGSMYGPQHEVYKQVALSKHFDAILFFETVSRARPNPLTQQSFGIRPPS